MPYFLSGFLAFGFAAFFSAAGFFTAVFFGVLAFLGLAAFGFTAFFGLAAGFFLGLTTSPLQPSLRNQQLIQNTAKWLVKQLLH
jgi:hypothetical protein